MPNDKIRLKLQGLAECQQVLRHIGEAAALARADLGQAMAR